MAEAVSLELQPREILGKKVKQLRRGGITPVHLYGRSLESRALQCESSKLLRALSQAGSSSAITLSIAGEKDPVLASPKELQWNPRNDRLLHVDFIRV